MKTKRTIKKKYNKNKIKDKRKKRSKKGGSQTKFKTYEPKCEHALVVLTIDHNALHEKIIKKMNSEDKNTDVFTEYTEQISEDYKQRNKKNANYYNERLLRSFFDCFNSKNKNINFINGYFKEI